MKKFKTPAFAPFVILPWEHAGADFDATPGATVRVEIGGKRRNLLLKTRAGRIFFKETARAQIFATLDIFDDALRGDELSERWETSVEAERYGALVTRRSYLSNLPVRAQFIFLVRPDGSALVQEPFDGQSWFELPRAAITPPLWHKALVGDAVALLMGAAQNAVLSRVVTPAQRALDPVGIVGGTRAEFALLVRGAVEAFAKNKTNAFEITLKSHSAFHKGELGSGYRFPTHDSPDFARVWALLEKHRPFVGLNWHERREHSEYSLPESERLQQAGIEQWGENWRGNWAPQRARFQIHFGASAHEQLESRLTLRDFLTSIQNSEDGAQAAELRSQL